MAEIFLSDIAAGSGGFVINGMCSTPVPPTDPTYPIYSPADRSGAAVASAGDVNGDGIADLIVGAPFSDVLAHPNVGRSYVVFGTTAGPTAIDLSAVAAGSGGFVIIGQNSQDNSGSSVSAAGDINGDGLADLIIGAPLGTPGGTTNAGRSYVVFGKSTNTTPIELGALSTGGFLINGQTYFDTSGTSVAAAGDVNGDGIADLIVGAPRNSNSPLVENGTGPGHSYVVFGQTGIVSINLSAVALGTGGFIINGEPTNGAKNYSGYSVAGAGDVNGDGLADLIVGSPFSDVAAGVAVGRSYVVFGQTTTTGVDLTAVAAGTGGFVINGFGGSDLVGYNVAAAGDVNGDGLADLVVGAPHYVDQIVSTTDPGHTYVVFGTTGTSAIELSAVANGNGGFVINGESAKSQNGFSVVAAGDVNGDGLSDLIVGAPASNVAGIGNLAGRGYLVFGQTGTTAIDLTAVAAGSGGFVINGQGASDQSSISVAAADLNGDGLVDLIVGAAGSDPAAGIDVGRTYVIFGSTTGVFAQTAVDQMGGSGDDTLTGSGVTETLVGGAGNDTLTGKGGADVLYGGTGDDVIVINAGNVAALASGVISGQLARVDGGGGLDTLALAGSVVTLDLGAIANQGASTPGSTSRLESIERIDLTGGGSNALILSAKDVIDLAGMDLIDSLNSAALGWANGTYHFASIEKRHQLIVDGNAGDIVTLSDSVSWTNAGTVTKGGNTYSVFNHNTVQAQLLIDSDLLNPNNLPTGTLSVGGTGTQGQTLTASNALADLDGLGSFTYQWKADDNDIAGATNSTLLLAEEQVGKAITVVASYTDGHGVVESVTSGATGAVANLNDVPTGTVTIGGIAKQGELLTASNALADIDGPVTLAISYQWKADGNNIVGATGDTLLLAEAQVDKTITVTASYTDGHGAAESVTSSATGAVVNVNDPAGVAISGTATQGQTLTAVASDADGLGTIGYQWKADGNNIVGATGDTLLLAEAQVDKTITVTASYTDGHGAAESVTSSATGAVVNVNDPAGVAISGTATQGQTLTAVASDADGLGTIGYQWKADGNDIVGATNSTLLLAEEQVGKAITVTASYTDGHSTAESVTSGATSSVANVNDAPTGTVTITGTATQNQTLTAVISTLADLDGLGTISYQWKADGNNIVGATSNTLVLAEAQVGKAITVTASYTDGHLTPESVTSGATSSVANVNDAPTGTVSITGTATQNQTLTAVISTLADLDGLGTISYQWKADGNNIVGATSSTLVLAEAQVGKAITVTASYTDGHLTPESVTSGPTSSVVNVNDAPTGTVTISGTASQGQTLTASNTLADPDSLAPLTISYQWKADGNNIVGATSSTLVLAETQVGKAITVAASYTDGHGTAESVASGATGSVANVNDAPTGVVSIGGSPAFGHTLLASNTLADLDGLGTVSYQWKADGNAIVGATGSTLLLAAPQIGTQITVTASYTDGHGTAESVTSNATGTVLPNNVPTGTVSISGTPKQGETLTASNDLADLDGLDSLTIAYQWQADGSDIVGATGNTLLLTEAQVDKTITVTASYVDGIGIDESVASAATGAVENENDPAGVVVTGTATQGQTLTAVASDADGLGTISYQWKANDSDIAGATDSTLVLAEAQVGKTITVTASYTDGHGTAESVTSGATGAVVNVNDPAGVAITGTATQGQTLAAAVSDADGLGTIGYQWKADGSDIVGATGSTLALGGAHVGKAITVAASFTDGHGTAESVTSDATLTVAAVQTGTSGDDVLVGTAVRDVLTGLGGADRLTGNAGDDMLDGGLGSDTALYAGLIYKQHLVTGNPAGSGSIDGPQGTDSLTSIETLSFADGSLNFDPYSHFAQVSRLYEATLNRAGDVLGLNYHTGLLDSGWTLSQDASSFVGSPEFQGNYGSLTNSQFVELVYQNVLHRAADGPGLAYWTGLMSSGWTKGDVVVSFSESAENVGNHAADYAAGLWNIDEMAGSVARLYWGTLGRAPDAGGLIYWTGLVKEGHAIQEAANNFVGSPEFQGNYGSLTNNQFVNQLYLNVLERPADSGGLAFWTGLLTGGATRGDVTLGFTESNEFQVKMIAQIDGGITTLDGNYVP